MAEITKGTNFFLEILVTDKNGDGVPGLTVTYAVIRCSDNTVLQSGTLSDVGNGVYQGSYLFAVNGQFRVLYFTPTKYTNQIETVTVTDATSTSISDKLDRILGLSQENYRVLNPVHDDQNNLTSGTIKIYPTATDCHNDTNPTAVYQVSATYLSGADIVTGYKVVRIS